MKVVILAGGKGTRISEYTKSIPKPMIELNKKKKIIEKIIDHYTYYGAKDFIIAGGYKFKNIENYFKSFSKKNISIKVINTGLNTLTGKRLFKLKKILSKDENFFLTYGDGLSSINLKKLYKFHISRRAILTLSAVKPPARFGEIFVKKNLITNFKEKPQLQKGWINGGFFVVNKRIFNFLDNRNVMFERDPMNKLIKTKKIFAYKHRGFWMCVDNLRDLENLKEYLKKNPRPWSNENRK